MFVKFEIVVCKLFQFGPVRNIVLWERVKAFADKKLNLEKNAGNLHFLRISVFFRRTFSEGSWNSGFYGKGLQLSTHST